MSHGTHVDETWHTCKWIMSRIWMSRGADINETWLAHPNKRSHELHQSSRSHEFDEVSKCHALNELWLSHDTYSWTNATQISRLCITSSLSRNRRNFTHSMSYEWVTTYTPRRQHTATHYNTLQQKDFDDKLHSTLGSHWVHCLWRRCGKVVEQKYELKTLNKIKNALLP